MSFDVTTLALAKSYTDQHSGDGGQVQSDWNQNDTSAKDYIKNRPGGYYVGPKIEIVSGTGDKFASRQSMKTYYR